jgi:hypothetical protein
VFAAECGKEGGGGRPLNRKKVHVNKILPPPWPIGALGLPSPADYETWMALQVERGNRESKKFC